MPKSEKCWAEKYREWWDLENPNFPYALIFTEYRLLSIVALSVALLKLV